MAFPSLRSKVATSFTSTTGSWTTDLPATVESGDLLIVAFFRHADSTITWDQSSHGTWTELDQWSRGSDGAVDVWVKVADGTEDSGSLSNTLGSNTRGSAWAAAIKDWYSDLAGVESEHYDFNTDSPDPASITASWGSDDNTFFVIMCGDGGTPSLNSYPTDFDDNQENAGAGGGPGASRYICSRENATATEDPGAFSLSTTKVGGAITIAIRPAAGGTTVNCTSESFTWTDNNASVSVGVTVNATSQGFTWTDNAATVTAGGVTVDCTSEAFTWTDNNAQVLVGTTVNASSESFTWADHNPQVLVGVTVNASAQSFTWTDYPVTVVSPTTITSGTQTFTWSDYPASVVVGLAKNRAFSVPVYDRRIEPEPVKKPKPVIAKKPDNQEAITALLFDA